MPYRLGIDLGTTFTAAAICRPAPDGTVLSELFPLGVRTASVPSVLYVSQGTTLVGEAAERRALTDPGCVVRDFKRRLGDDTPIVVGDEPHHAHDLAATLVQWVVDRVSEREGEPPDAIAVTYPAAWGPHRKSLLQNALGDEVVLLTEPQAAALQYSSAERVEPGSTIAVYDLGGGTFDAAVVHKTTDGDFELLGPPEGLECLGGIDFDDAVLARVLPATGCSDPVSMARLRRECTEAKEALSADVEAVVPVLLPDVNTQVHLTRAEFESLIRPILDETVRSLSRAISSAGLRADQVTAVLLVGGSSRIPLITTLISTALDRPVAVDTDPKGVVALGAALAAHRSVAVVEESGMDGLIPEPRRPDHDCAPPVLKRPRRRLRRTRVILYTAGMLVLALTVIPSPFTSQSDTSPPAKDPQPTQTSDAPAAPAAGPVAQPGSPTRKHTPKAQQAGAKPTGDKITTDDQADLEQQKQAQPSGPSSTGSQPQQPTATSTGPAPPVSTATSNPTHSQTPSTQPTSGATTGQSPPPDPAPAPPAPTSAAPPPADPAPTASNLPSAGPTGAS